ncbi:hypothetical protein S83_065583 [Arachis hypogaea]|uniref:Uncharacterized protein n=1 Tax=Arachis hypogaea TaxID=3818 RepID=A0A6B9V7A8_ARAHY|nr:uncharacterized protein LOC112779275 isoform X1 [Arachis hypogaea]QHN76581.1 uncharacterized protein DS421_19g645140 [Arachis hypogaea]
MALKYAIIISGLLAMAVMVPSKVAARDFPQTFSNYNAEGVIEKDLSVGGHTTHAPSEVAVYKEEKSESNVGLDGLKGPYMPGLGGSIKKTCFVCCISLEECTICCN